MEVKSAFLLLLPLLSSFSEPLFLGLWRGAPTPLPAPTPPPPLVLGGCKGLKKSSSSEHVWYQQSLGTGD